MALQPPVPPGPPPMGTPPRGLAPKLPPVPGAVPPPPGAAAAGPGAAGAPGPGEGEEEPQAQLSFFQQPWVQNILPFVSSLIVHAVIIVLGIAAYKVVADNIPQLLNKEQTVIPEATLAEAAPPGGIPNQGLNNDPFHKAMQDTTPDGAKPDGWANKAGPTVDIQAAGSQGDTDASPLAIGPNGVMGSAHGTGVGSGQGDGSGPLAQFGMVSGGGAIGPHGPVFGNGGNARQIIFVCDASGSMLNKMATLKNELQKAVDGLKPIQSFNIVFFQDNKCVALDNSTMVPATPDNKRKAFGFLDNVTTSGTTDPMPGLTLAFNQHPQLVYLLTDGDFPDNKAVKAKIGELNSAHKTKINTIAFVGSTDTDTEFLAILEDIAKTNGGTFRHVAENELTQ